MPAFDGCQIAIPLIESEIKHTSTLVDATLYESLANILDCKLRRAFGRTVEVLVRKRKLEFLDI
jgi:hypothetical protein